MIHHFLLFKRCVGSVLFRVSLVPYFSNCCGGALDSFAPLMMRRIGCHLETRGRSVAVLTGFVVSFFIRLGKRSASNPALLKHICRRTFDTLQKRRQFSFFIFILKLFTKGTIQSKYCFAIGPTKATYKIKKLYL